MTHRRLTGIKPFILRVLLRTSALALAIALLAAAGFLRIRLTKDARAVSLSSSNQLADTPDRAPDSLRVATYNIAHGRGPSPNADHPSRGDPAELLERLETIGRTLGRSGLDLVALQQVDFNCWWSHGINQAEVIAEAAGFPHVALQRNFDTGIPFFRRVDTGNVLLSRFPIRDLQRVEFPPHRHLTNMTAGNHDALLARIEIGRNREILVLTTRLDPRSEDVRVRAAGEIIRIQRASPLPMILLGDFNSAPPGVPGSRLSAGGQNTLEVLESFGGFQRRPARGQGSPADFTHPTHAPRRIVDWILPDRNWSFMQYELIRGLRESDHFPVMTTLRRR